MASRRVEKNAARQARLAAEAEAARARVRQRRLLSTGGLVLIAVAVAAVAVVISGGSSRSAGLVRSTRAAAGIETTVKAELAGIPQRGTTLGRSSAPVTIEYFGDLECPYCAVLTDGEDGGGLPALIDGPVRAGQVKLVYRSMETASLHANAKRWLPQQMAAYAAGVQNRFWDYAELFYHQQGDEDTHYVTEAYLDALAHETPSLNLARWRSDRHDSALAHQIAADGAQARSYGLPGTPSLVAIGRHGSRLIPANDAGVESFASMRAAIRAVS